MRTDADVLVVGGGLAAQRTCETLRRLGWPGRVRVVGDEPHPPYDRPPLSKALLTGERGPEVPLLRPEGWYREHDIELLLGAHAVAFDPVARCVHLQDGASLRYGRLVVATGSRPRRLERLFLSDVVRELRTIDDARALREALGSGIEHLAIVGAGLIGMEVASSAVALGVGVTLIEAAATPLGRVLPAEISGWLAAMHARAGVDVLLGRTVERASQSGARVALSLSDHRRIAADLVLVAAGTLPATSWLAGSGLGPGGIRVDAGGRTALPGVYAAGDAAHFPDPATGRPQPSPHWEAAAHQGGAVARAIVGAAAKPPQPPVFWSDQYGVRIQFVGRPGPFDRVEYDGDPAAGEFAAWLMDAGRPVGALLVGRPQSLPSVRRRIAAATGGMATAA